MSNTNTIKTYRVQRVAIQSSVITVTASRFIVVHFNFVYQVVILTVHFNNISNNVSF